MIAYVLCANDSIEAVVLSNHDEAENELLKLRNKHWKLHCHSFRDVEEFDNRIYWHIHEVNVLGSS